jgi:diguanylate cyclase (GGDEF)-like protein
MPTTKLRNTVHGIALGAATVVAVLFPALHSLDKYEEQSERLLLKASINASRVARHIHLNEDIWRYQIARLSVLTELPANITDTNRSRVLDKAGRVVLESGPAIEWPILTRSVPIFVKGDAVGSIEIDKSLRGLLVEVSWLALLGVLFGFGIYLAVRLYPMRALDRTLTMLEERNLHLDQALAHMSHGLCMFDREGRLAVWNADYAAIYRLPPQSLKAGVSRGAVHALCVSNGILKDQGSAKPPVDRKSSVTMKLGDGRLVAVDTEPMKDGGWVEIHEDITERYAIESRTAYLASHDVLTGLLNRAAFIEKVHAAIAGVDGRGGAFSLLVLDVDKFKDINDELGHPAGDLVLQEVARRLNTRLGEADTLARLGGDEFAIILSEETSGHRSIVGKADDLVDAFASPFDIEGDQLNVSVSVGVANFPDDGSEPFELLKKADIALYRAKAAGRNQYCLFSSEMLDELNARHRLEQDLRAAIQDESLELHYQLIIDARTGAPCGVEALSRWRHPEFGMIAPDKFIPLAEQTGLIHPLGQWVLQKACADAVGWPDNIKLAINISPAQFKQADLVDVIICALVESGLAPRRLEIEITEMIVLANDPEFWAMLHQLKSLGVSIALDDFGTGYSSLSYLTMFPFDKLKIDQSFVKDMALHSGHAAIVVSTIAAARGMDMSTTAEGVETTEQRDLLRAGGVNFMQGYLFGRPVPASALDFGLDAVDARADSAA